MSPGEISILVTSVLAVVGSLANMYFTNAKSNRVSDDLIRCREQDRLDREQVAKELLDLQKHELEMAKVEVSKVAAEVRQKVEAAAEKVERRLTLNEQLAASERNQIIEITRHGAQRAEQAYHEANTVNQKLEKIGLENIEQQKRRTEQDQKIEAVVVNTEEKVEDVHRAVVLEKS